MKKVLTILFVIVTIKGFTQENKNVLFLGNSYTFVNNLPSLVSQMASSTGDILTYETNTLGGYSLADHWQNSTSHNKISQGNWDFVVLQEQSQKPSFPIDYVQTNVYPFAQRLTDSIVKYNPCGRTAFYMTWGRENGDANNCSFYPPLCTYQGMDDLLRERYQYMADNNDAIVSAVGPVWRYLRENYPTLDLYNNDSSHPSLIGSYAGAMTFYTALFRKDPTLITFNSSLSTADATIIKNAVKLIVFDDFLEWNIGDYDLTADFLFTNNGNDYSFINQSISATDYLWDFGDGTTSTEENPQHTYTQDNDYTVTLTTNSCGNSVDLEQEITVTLKVNSEQINSITCNTLVEDKIHFINKNTTDKYVISIYNSLGKVVFKKELINNYINVNHLEKGLYFISLKQQNSITFQTKFIKK